MIITKLHDGDPVSPASALHPAKIQSWTPKLEYIKSIETQQCKRKFIYSIFV